MNTPMGGIEGLEEAVMEEAQERAREILSDAQDRAEQLRQHNERDVEAKRAAIVRRAEAKAEALRNDAAAEGHLQAQNYKLKHRESLLDRVFDQVHKRLVSLVERDDYLDLVEAFIREAVVRLEEEAVRVRTGQRTDAILDDAALDALTEDLGVTLKRGEPLPDCEGVLIETLDEHRQYDNTLDSRLDRMQEELRAPVFHLLMGKEP
jgi:V/A-type H+-transporting ATPase subunit E